MFGLVKSTTIDVIDAYVMFVITTNLFILSILKIGLKEI